MRNKFDLCNYLIILGLLTVIIFMTVPDIYLNIVSRWVLVSRPIKPHKHVSPHYKKHLSEQLENSETAYQKYIKNRKAFVPNPKKVNPWPPFEVMYFWDYFLPSFSCPHTLQRVGNLGDGGKWVCGLELHNKEDEKPCVVYSFGVGRQSSFEAEILSNTNCLVYAFDGTVSKMGPEIKENNPRLTFSKISLSSSSFGPRRLSGLMQSNGHAWIDILKIDIEGSELNVLDQLMDEFQVLPFGQLLIELHGDNDGLLFAPIYKLWERLEGKGLRPFMNEVASSPCVRTKIRPIYAEYSFINILGPGRLLPQNIMKEGCEHFKIGILVASGLLIIGNGFARGDSNVEVRENSKFTKWNQTSRQGDIDDALSNFQEADTALERLSGLTQLLAGVFLELTRLPLQYVNTTINGYLKPFVVQLSQQGMSTTPKPQNQGVRPVRPVNIGSSAVVAVQGTDSEEFIEDPITTQRPRRPQRTRTPSPGVSTSDNQWDRPVLSYHQPAFSSRPRTTTEKGYDGGDEYDTTKFRSKENSTLLATGKLMK